MQPARGDSRPCVSAGCAGTMQFGRESVNDAARVQGAAPPAYRAHDDEGWICSKDPDHFQKQTHA